jgi:hypothetical protein
MNYNLPFYDLINVETSYPEDFELRVHYIEEVIENLLYALINKPVEWVLRSDNNPEKIFNLIVEAKSKKSTSNIVKINMIIAALITLEPTYKAKFKLLGIAI